MKLPWSSRDELEQRKEELEHRIEELEEERDSIRERFEAEKERRSRLATEKQEAEEKLNRLQDRLESLRQQEEQTEEKNDAGLRELELEDAVRLLEKLGSVESPERDLVTVYSPGEVEEVEDIKGLKNAIDPGQLEALRASESFAAFLDPDREPVILKTRPVFDAEWSIDESFEVSQLREFIDREKVFALVSAGKTSVYREQSGDYEELRTVKSRVDREHSKGGFSQDRFERKREEQVDEHLDQVEDALQDFENVYLLGDSRLCEQLPGKRLGGFDPNRRKPEVFYSFQRLTFL